MCGARPGPAQPDPAGHAKEDSSPTGSCIDDGRVMTTILDEVLGGTRLTLSIEMAMSEEQERAGYTQILRHLAKHLATLSEGR